MIGYATAVAVSQNLSRLCIAMQNKSANTK